MADRYSRTYRRAQVIFRAGDRGTEMFVILAGRVEIIAPGGSGDTVVAILKAGDFFGEMALVESLPRSATAVAAEDGTRLIAIDHAKFVYLASQQPAFALLVMQGLSRRLRATSGEAVAAPDGGAVAAPKGAQGDGTAPCVVELHPGIHQIAAAGHRGGHVYVLRGRRKTLLIDTGLPQDFGHLQRSLESIGLAVADIHLVVLTHEHMDHVGGVPFLPPHVVVAAHGLAARKIDMQDEFVLMNRAFDLAAGSFHVDLRIGDATTIDLGGYALQILHAPGHCSGAIALYEAERELLFTGDVVFAGGTLGGIFTSGNISDYIDSLTRLRALRTRHLYPGHGRVSDTPAEDLDRAMEVARGLAQDSRAFFDALNAGASFEHILRSAAGYARGVK